MELLPLCCVACAQSECEELTSRVQMLSQENTTLKAELQRMQEAFQSLAQRGVQLEVRRRGTLDGPGAAGGGAC